jgi:acyl carrier protein
MDTQQTRQAIRDFIKGTFFADDFADSDSFLQSGLIDSTGILQLAEFVEQHLEVKVEDVDLVPDNIDSVDNLVAFIERKRSRSDTP